MKRYLLPYGLFLLSITFPAPAFAALWEEGITSGCQLTWSGTLFTPNDIYVQPGQIEINATSYNCTIGQIDTSALPAGVFWENGTGGAQTSNTVYYVYAIVNPNTGALQYVIALVNPNPGGDPSQSLTYNAGSGNVNTPFALFLGSYITDSTTSADIVPFLKEGDDVILTPLQDTYSFGQIFFASAIFDPAPPAYPQAVTASFTAASTPIPLTASGLILDFDMTNYDSTYHDARILNPTLDTDVGAGVCTANSQYYLAVAPATAAVTAWPYGHARIKTAVNTSVTPSGMGGQPGTLTNALNSFVVGGCTAPAALTSYSVWAAYVGYTEVTHHLSF